MTPPFAPVPPLSHATKPFQAQPMNRDRLLDAYYQEIDTLIISRQTPLFGLLPASTAITVHGDYTDAWVRDNVYSILAVWGLALAYRKMDEGDRGRTYELEQRVVKLMRGLLVAMMKQAPKVEKFKQTQAPLDALHAKYHSRTGETVVPDDGWGHLQLDATSIYLLMLAQMTTSGLTIVQTSDEVNFVQNLVYYIGRAYRTPDYGIWERGNKTNHGKPELNASSVGMAKAALEAMNGLNLFGLRGGLSSVIYVLPDEIARARITLESLLPRESGSKEVDGALLSVIGFPAFAVDDPVLSAKTRDKIIAKLQGRYGCKRFLRDGHQTVIEDITRLHYEPGELQQFEHIECEWPLFFTYLLLDALFRGDHAVAQDYRTRLDQLVVKQGPFGVLPELYYVPEPHIEAERHDPSSQTRLPNENVPLVWAQSLYLLGRMIQDDLLSIGDLDPLGRHQQGNQSKISSQPGKRRSLVQIALLAENVELQTELATYGIATQTPQELEAVQVRQASDLADLYAHIGSNASLGLTGRPQRRLRSLTTSRFFKIQGETVVFLPSFLDSRQFYLTLDYHFLVAQIKGELAYICRHWSDLGRPAVILFLTHKMFGLGDSQSLDQSPLLGLMKQLRDGESDGTPVQLGTVQQLLLTAKIERVAPTATFQFDQQSLQQGAQAQPCLKFNPDGNWPLSQTQEFRLECETNVVLLMQTLRESGNLYEQIELLESLTRLNGLDFQVAMENAVSVTVRSLLTEVYENAAEAELWTVIRRAAGLLNKVDMGLSDAVTDIVICQKQISVGKSYTEESLITEPMSHDDIMGKIQQFCGEDVRDRALTQEMLIYLSVLLKTNPALFDGLLTLRVGYLILLITSAIAAEEELSQAEAYEVLMQLSPFDVKSRLLQVLEGYSGYNQTLFKRESLPLRQQNGIEWSILPEAIAHATDEPTPVNNSWRLQRQQNGMLNLIPEAFYPNVWQVLHHCKGLAIGDKLERRNCLDSELLLSDTTPEEKDFALRVDHLLNKISAPEYRQLNVEALAEVAAITQQNSDFQVEGTIVLDVLIGHAVRLCWLEQGHKEDLYHEEKSAAWQAFYETPPRTCAQYVAKALQFLTELGSVG
ncbi:MAG: glycoside hydrolase family 15 protein [Leptolyngbyaceae cyanobacterium]